MMSSFSEQKPNSTFLELLKAFVAFGESYYCSLVTKQREDHREQVWEEFRTIIEELDGLEATVCSFKAGRLLVQLAYDIRNRESMETLGWEIERFAHAFLRLN